jgi:hypothetical protein
MFIEPLSPPVVVPPEIIEFTPMKTGMFHSAGEPFMFIGLLVCIGMVGVYAIYRIWKEFFRNEY